MLGIVRKVVKEDHPRGDGTGVQIQSELGEPRTVVVFFGAFVVLFRAFVVLLEELSFLERFIGVSVRPSCAGALSDGWVSCG